MSLLEMRHVTRVYGQGAAEVRALQDIDLDVDAGIMVAVMGPSGSGKSTLLTIAGSLEEPTSGQVRICGQELTTLPATPRRGSGAEQSGTCSRISACCPA